MTCIGPSDKRLWGWMQWTNMGSYVRGRVQYYSTTTQDPAGCVEWMSAHWQSLQQPLHSDITCRGPDAPPVGLGEYFTKKPKYYLFNCCIKLHCEISDSETFNFVPFSIPALKGHSFYSGYLSFNKPYWRLFQKSNYCFHSNGPLLSRFYHCWKRMPTLFVIRICICV